MKSCIFPKYGAYLYEKSVLISRGLMTYDGRAYFWHRNSDSKR